MRYLILLCGFVVVLKPAPTLAQTVDRLQPRLDLGFAAAGGVVPHETPERLLQTRAAVALGRRFALEGIVDVRRNPSNRDMTLSLYYTIQGRRLIGPQTGRVSAAITFGGTGTFDRWRTRELQTELYWPVAPTFGVAVQYAVAPLLAIRGDVRAIVCPYFDAIGVVTAAGVSVPIGPGVRR